MQRYVPIGRGRCACCKKKLCLIVTSSMYFRMVKAMLVLETFNSTGFQYSDRAISFLTTRGVSNLPGAPLDMLLGRSEGILLTRTYLLYFCELAVGGQ